MTPTSRIEHIHLIHANNNVLPVRLDGLHVAAVAVCSWERVGRFSSFIIARSLLIDLNTYLFSHDWSQILFNINEIINIENFSISGERVVGSSKSFQY